MTEEMINKRIEYLRYQRDNNIGNYRKYLVNLYNYYNNKAKSNNSNWCYTDWSDIENLYYAIREGCSNPDVSRNAIKGYTKELEDYGYFKWGKDNKGWKIIILKPLDF